MERKQATLKQRALHDSRLYYKMFVKHVYRKRLSNMFVENVCPKRLSKIFVRNVCQTCVSKTFVENVCRKCLSTMFDGTCWSNMLVGHVCRTCMFGFIVYFVIETYGGDGIYASKVRMMLDDLRGFSKKPEKCSKKALVTPTQSKTELRHCVKCSGRG